MATGGSAIKQKDAMDAESWRKNFRRNTVTNYLGTIVRLGIGLVVFRLLFQRLNHEQFGYYKAS